MRLQALAMATALLLAAMATQAQANEDGTVGTAAATVGAKNGDGPPSAPGADPRSLRDVTANDRAADSGKSANAPTPSPNDCSQAPGTASARCR